MIDADTFADHVLDLVKRADRAKLRHPVYPRLIAELALRLSPQQAAQALAVTEIAVGLLAPSQGRQRADELARELFATPINNTPPGPAP